MTRITTRLTGVMTGLRSLPKADLHLHQEMSPRLDRVLAKRENRAGYDWASWRRSLLDEIPPGIERLDNLSKVFPVARELDAEDDLFVARVVDTLTEAAEDGACFVEVRFGNETVVREDFMGLFRQAEAEARRRYPALRAEAVVTVVQFLAPDRLTRVVEGCVEAAAEGLAGIDLLYQPYHVEADWKQAYALAERFAAVGLGITAHAGEFSTANIAAAARTPGLTRIGHGVHAAADPALMGLLADRKITLECCLTCNRLLGAIDEYPEHPLRRLLDHGVRVVLGTDNPVQVGTTIGKEYEAAAALGCDLDDLLRFTRTALEVGFTTEPRRRRMLAEFDLGYSALIATERSQV
ncbi:hypothetical protein ABZ260_46070 [Streptosporangium sp. NPDC006013]|uniref:adenosine deaminase family protein n=1 Tax=Streptosporangium sp. NPDC006013 TaxID=3155596 RepID=UPI0033AE30E0